MLTKNSKFVILHLYKIYLDRIEDGESINSASYFGSDEVSHGNYFLGMDFDTYVSSVHQIGSHGYAIVAAGDGGFAEMALSNEGIAYCENETNKNYSVLIQAISDLKKLII
ncbi:hypothetical protein [Staphylococcus sp. HMSC061G12]|uniref:hypothetical protein n=1 Tax=Staphylococcus sp. HMSC061G12 TaxID=1739441 RepID=UPI0008A8D706|nr:hypothetical protein [Staphylococcus sp. HMSC061G12]OHR53657.1 hypothetical protein HMPREF2937_11460 [Staphylococcus sp. HMSC061G12]